MRASLPAAIAFATLVAGCGSSDEKEGPLGAPPTYPVPECKTIDQRACDIRGAHCQERLMKLAACLRGSDPIDVPAITLMTEEEFATYLNEQNVGTPVPEPDHFEIALASVGLVQPGALAPEALVANDVEFIWGLYRRQQKDVILVDHGVPADEPDPNAVLVHEFVHALQDVDVDLGSYFGEHATSYDSYLAAASISEGEARMHQMRFYAALIGLDPSRLDWDGYFEGRAKLAEELVIADPSPYLASFGNFQYELGARFVHHAWVERSATGVNSLFAAPPARTQAVMASVSVIASADWPEPEFADLAAPEGWALVAQDSLGAWGTLLYLSGTFIPEFAHERALEWRGDTFQVYASNATPPETALVWRIEFASESEASAAVPRVLPGTSHVTLQGNRLVITATTGASPLDWALEP